MDCDISVFQCLPREIILHILCYVPVKYSYTVYRLSYQFRQYLRDVYDQENSRRYDPCNVLALIVNEVETDAVADDILERVVQRYAWNKDIGYYRLLYHFMHTYDSSSSAFSILCQTLCQYNQPALAKYIASRNPGCIKNGVLLRHAIRFDATEIFDYALETGERRQCLGHSEVNYAIVYRKKHLLRKLLAIGTPLYDHMGLLFQAIAALDADMVDAILCTPDCTVLQNTQQYRRLLRSIGRHRWVPRDSVNQLIRCIDSHHERIIAATAIKTTTLTMDAEGNIRINGIVTYDDIVTIVKHIKTLHDSIRHKYRDSDGLADAEHKDRVKLYLEIIQRKPRPWTLDIKASSFKDRYVIYKLCELLRIRFKRIDRHTKTVDCWDFNPSRTIGCGCHYLPRKIQKRAYYGGFWNHQYNIPWTHKEGVRLYFTPTQVDPRCHKQGCDIISNLMRCSRCKDVYYCCADHQQKDWSTHKPHCHKPK